MKETGMETRLERLLRLISQVKEEIRANTYYFTRDDQDRLSRLADGLMDEAKSAYREKGASCE